MLDRNLFDEQELEQLSKDFQQMRLTALADDNPFFHTINSGKLETPGEEDKTSVSSYRTISDLQKKKKEEEQMSPMYVFLASSLNVELVYSILKGITQFGYLTLCEP